MDPNLPRHNPPQKETIQRIFDDIANRYDITNTVLSFGTHKLWKKKAVEWALVKENEEILDCATGTGDLAFLFAKKYPKASVTGIDFSHQMLEKARLKQIKTLTSVTFQYSDITSLSFADQSFDVISIAFGIRNVENPLDAISEFQRVLKPKGRLIILEFGQPPGKVFKKIYTQYSRRLLPSIGGLLTGNKEAYNYLDKSAKNFPCENNFISWVEKNSNFCINKMQPLSGGIAYLYRFSFPQ